MYKDLSGPVLVMDNSQNVDVPPRLKTQGATNHTKPSSDLTRPMNPTMQMTPPLAPSPPSSFPLLHHRHRNIPLPKGPFSSFSSSSSSGFLSTVSKAMEEEEEYRKARAEVHGKDTTMKLEGFTVEGVSIGGHETCVIVPEFKCAFDIGRCPLRAVNQSFVFITHGHLDHIGGLPMYVATRELYSLKPGTIVVPSCIRDDVEKLFDVHRSLGQVELNVEIVSLDVGETMELRNDLVVRPFKTHHAIPSQGYLIYSIKKKLRKQYMHLKGKEIEKLKKSGVEIVDVILSPEVAFTGDTTSDFMLEPRNADALRAKLLITEATFLDEGISVEHARQHGHTHLSEIIENAQWIRNKAILLTHFSSRYHVEDIREAVSKLQTKVPAKVAALTEGFKWKRAD